MLISMNIPEKFKCWKNRYKIIGLSLGVPSIHWGMNKLFGCVVCLFASFINNVVVDFAVMFISYWSCDVEMYLFLKLRTIFDCHPCRLVSCTMCWGLRIVKLQVSFVLWVVMRKMFIQYSLGSLLKKTWDEAHNTDEIKYIFLNKV